MRNCLSCIYCPIWRETEDKTLVPALEGKCGYALPEFIDKPTLYYVEQDGVVWYIDSVGVIHNIEDCVTWG